MVRHSSTGAPRSSPARNSPRQEVSLPPLREAVPQILASVNREQADHNQQYARHLSYSALGPSAMSPYVAGGYEGTAGGGGGDRALTTTTTTDGYTLTFRPAYAAAPPPSYSQPVGPPTTYGTHVHGHGHSHGHSHNHSYAHAGPPPTYYSNGAAYIAAAASSADQAEEQRVRRRRGNLPRAVTDLLKTWFYEHREHPYPSEEEKQYLMSRTGLTLTQACRPWRGL
ncbi:MAG: Homeobox protein tgif1 [Phylliscum demangeonii]|nr:MAG: Homeobox protein tgif1 [Phylliscum demangeonii]